jgi:hypothetical protein
MAKESPLGIFFFISEWVATALLPVLFLTEMFFFISPLII